MKLRTFLVSILVTVACGVSLLPITAQADTLSAKGIDKDSAIITDGQGKVQSHTADLTESGYHVSWHWSIPDQVKIKSGDTMQVEVPDNVMIPHALTFDILNSTGIVVGQANFAANSPTGTVTFNNELADKTLNRKGEIYIYASGKAIDDQLPSDWLINKSGWWESEQHNKINWNIALNPAQDHLGHVTLTDTLGAHQSYIPGSVQAQTGTWDDQGQFTPDGGTLDVTVSQKSDRSIQFDLANVKTGVNLQYQSKATGNPNGATYTNDVTLDADNLGGGDDDGMSRNQSSAQLSFGGGGTGDGDMDIKPDVPEKPTTPNQPVTPEKPAQPQDPVTPEKPVQPQQPVAPKKHNPKKQPKQVPSTQVPANHPQDTITSKASEHATPANKKQPQHQQLPLTDVAKYSFLSLIGLVILSVTGTLYFKSHHK
ncbi:hypothetical protein K3977_01555 [Weissella viridescens]|uniref:collagen binding domain-containing protein n=1 Tax=Weissella viridescens TaxID=1629 RepID=UPI001C7CF524|nr:collagen binding domain-containing protein [Weissella viridescens]MBX4172313.1 hypothetical protein [Weissella viridescens]